MALEGNIKVPGLGEVSKKAAVIGGGAGIAIVAVVIIRKKSAANAANAANADNTAPATTQAASTDQTDPAGNVGQIDPATGYVYGSPEDEQALSQGSTADYSDLEDDLGDDSGIDPNTGIPYADEIGSGESGTGTTTTTPTTRETWLEQAISDMNAPSLATIAPSVWAGIAVSSADKATFLEAVALEGSPPGGYPSPIKLTDTPAQAGPTSSVTVPKVTGERGEVARQNLQAAGFKVSQSPSTTPKGKTTTVTGQTPAGGSKAKKGATVHLTVKVT